MTIRQINQMLRDTELAGAPPLERITALVSIFRSCNAGQCVDIVTVALGLLQFKKGYGEISTESIDKFMEMPDQMLDLDIPNDLVLEYLGGVLFGGIDTYVALTQRDLGL